MAQKNISWTEDVESVFTIVQLSAFVAIEQAVMFHPRQPSSIEPMEVSSFRSLHYLMIAFGSIVEQASGHLVRILVLSMKIKE